MADVRPVHDSNGDDTIHHRLERYRQRGAPDQLRPLVHQPGIRRESLQLIRLIDFVDHNPHIGSKYVERIAITEGAIRDKVLLSIIR